MSSRSIARPAAGAIVALLFTSPIFAAAGPAIPPAAEIPVAPVPKPRKVIVGTPPPPETTTTTTTTTTITAPPLTALVVDTPPAATGVAEAMPAPPLAPIHVVMVDELPFHPGQGHPNELREHGRRSKKHGRHGRPYHPAPGIVVDVSDASGAVGAGELQRAARNVGYWPFRRCYEEGLRRDQHASGKVQLDIGVTAAGGVDSASIANASVHDESSVLCVAREARHLTLASSDASTSAKLSVTLSTGDEPVPVPHAVPHAADLRDVLRASWPSVQQCYATGLARHPDAGGRLELRFRVGASGEIEEVAEDESRFSDVDVTRCVLGVYRSAKLGAVGRELRQRSFVYALHLEARK